MTAGSCGEIVGKLVDYADGELPDSESAEFAEHIARCDHCRSRFVALQESLDLARIIWGDSEAGLATAGPESASKPTRPRVAWHPVRWAAAIAAAVALLVVFGLYQRSVRQDVPAVMEHAAPTTLRELELQIARAGIAMQLLTAADILAQQPGGEDYACERYRYVVASYPDTEAAVQSESRLASLCEERNGS